MALTKIDVCNKALSLIGQQGINSIEENNENARQCRLHFDNDRDSVQQDFNWTFCTRIEKLALVDKTDPRFALENFIGWEYLYKYPSDCLKMRKLLSEGTRQISISDIDIYEENYRLVQLLSGREQIILSNMPNAYAEYTKRTQDITLWDAVFLDAIAYKLASSIVSGLTGSATKGTEMLQIYSSLINRARVVNSSADIKLQRKPQSLIDCRR